MSSPARKLRITCLLVAIIASGCATATAAAQSEASSRQVVESSTTTTTTTTTTTSTTTTTAAPTTTTTIPDPHRTLIATARDRVSQLVAYESPGGLPMALPFPVPNPHQFGGPLTLRVTQGEVRDGWVKAQLPVRPNGREGWIPVKDYVFSETFVRAEVDLATTTVRVFDRDELIAESQAAIGNSRTPTPLGTFFVAAKRLNPPAEAYLGTWAIVLSGYSEVLETFSGGLPVIAIHGSNNPSRVLGRAVSNGCVRVPNDVIQFIADHVPLGAPVHITA